MANLNRIILIGRLTADPEARFTVDGTPMTKFTLAVNRFQKEGVSQGTDLIDIVTWRKLAEISGQYLKKGALALIEGRIQIRTYEDKAGIRKWATEVVARNMQMLESASKEKAVHDAPAAGFEDLDEALGASEDLPF